MLNQLKFNVLNKYSKGVCGNAITDQKLYP